MRIAEWYKLVSKGSNNAYWTWRKIRIKKMEQSPKPKSQGGGNNTGIRSGEGEWHAWGESLQKTKTKSFGTGGSVVSQNFVAGDWSATDV